MNDLHTNQGRAAARKAPPPKGIGAVIHQVVHVVAHPHIRIAAPPPPRRVANPQRAAQRVAVQATRRTAQAVARRQPDAVQRRQTRAKLNVPDVRKASPSQKAALRRRGLIGALFSQEGPQLYHAAFVHNAPFATPGSYQTKLPAPQESAFRSWVKANRIPFDVNASKVDYDMRGFFKAGGTGAAANGHFPDTFKTPYDTTFSHESKYATIDNPFVWHGNTLIDKRTGAVVFK